MAARTALTAVTRPRRLWAAFGLGAAAALGHAPLGLWPVALLGLAGIVALVAGADTAGRAARRAWIAGGGYFAASLNWIVEPFLVDIARHGWMAPFALVLMAFGLALFWAAAGWLSARLVAGRAARGLLFAIVLVLAEALRGYVFTGFPWALIGHVWIGTPVMQLAALGGPHLLSLIAVLAATLPVALAAGQARAAGLALSVLLVAGTWGAGALRLAAPVPGRPDAPLIRVIQPNAAQHLKWRRDMIPLFWERQLALTAYPQGPRPDLVIWPETSVPFMLERAGGALDEIAAAARGAPAIVGVQRREGRRTFNSLAVVGPDGALGQVYDKHHLVPFGEYVPFAGVLGRLGIKGLAANDVYGYAAGPGAALIDLGRLGQALPLICYEAIFPRDVRAAPGRADWLLQITNDAWFGRWTGPYQHLAQARLRAVEQGLPMVRAANTGVSAMIDARGRFVDRLALNSAGQFTAPLPPALPATPYARTGDAPALLVLVLAGAGLVAARRRK
ncbi:apolipoprotein N-acyltransferase [Rhodovulum iodosum]|uniref:Apolipoprotein N-acyltransferase n=1 Tax=Rhodovulum iodosum TaxID=68291 RepID=A0ABV3XWU9_9RHOB|nr:apolipoprotein N-acyltransferase [Rhodovulum robiginosum]RSK34119.1 apolipoprotein N-acyltransferase [Rhodovulum robiginosum]